MGRTWYRGLLFQSEDYAEVAIPPQMASMPAFRDSLHEAGAYDDKAFRSVRTRSSNRNGLRRKPRICGALIAAISSL